MTTDTELEVWRQAWCDQTAPLPELKKKIRRQNLWTAGAIVAIALCIGVSTFEAWLHRSDFLAGVAAGVSFASVVMGVYALRVRRGAWKPSAQTTLAYAELAHNRAVAKVRILQFSFRFLLIATALYAGFVGWHWRTFPARDWMLVAALCLEAVFIRYQARRKERAVGEAKKLLDDLTN